jgi:hypothetical protein
MSRLLALLICVAICQTGFGQNDSDRNNRATDKVQQQSKEDVFSGPQPGEVLVPFKVTGIYEPHAGKELDPVKLADGKPSLLIFFHERTRPAFGLMNAVNRYAATRSKDGLQSTVVFLNDDASMIASWAKQMRKNLPKDVTYTVSKEGVEGPGAYGLNRNVSLTVLIGNDNKVTANFALVQPSIPTDGQKILQAIVAVMGGGDVPDIAKFGGRSMTQRAKMVRADPELARLLKSLSDGEKTNDDLKAVIVKVDDYVKEHPRAKAALTQLVNRIPADKRRELKPLVVRAIRKWQKSAEGRQQDPELRSMLRAVIQKNAADEAVDKAAAAVEEYIAKNEAAKKEIGQIATRIVNSDRLEAYGTKHCQDILRNWAKKYGPQKDAPQERGR